MAIQALKMNVAKKYYPDEIADPHDKVELWSSYKVVYQSIITHQMLMICRHGHFYAEVACKFILAKFHSKNPCKKFHQE